MLQNLSLVCVLFHQQKKINTTGKYATKSEFGLCILAPAKKNKIRLVSMLQNLSLVCVYLRQQKKIKYDW
jgi:hypothetical protein